MEMDIVWDDRRQTGVVWNDAGRQQVAKVAARSADRAERVEAYALVHANWLRRYGLPTRDEVRACYGLTTNADERAVIEAQIRPLLPNRSETWVFRRERLLRSMIFVHVDSAPPYPALSVEEAQACLSSSQTGKAEVGTQPQGGS
jgi:hypothetical protein